LDAEAINAALVAGAPWYTSGAQKWNGAAATLKPKPIVVVTIAIASSGFSVGPWIALAMPARLIEFESPYSRLNPNSRNAADIPPKRKYFSAASHALGPRLSNAVST
jgi:hypothetical protein